MDTLTQAVLGASIAEAFFRGRLGGRAVFFGAACGLLPDLDVVFSAGDPWSSLQLHRGPSHSLLVLPWVALPVGWLGWRLGGRTASWQRWVHLAFWALVTHPLLDTCTTYGTQLLAPLSDLRFSTDAVGIIDLVYTLPLLGATLLAALPRVSRTASARVATAALGLSTAYLGLGHLGTWRAHQLAEEALVRQGIEAVSLRTPAPILVPGVRRVVAREADGRLWAGQVSLLVTRELLLSELPQDRGPAVEAALDSREGRIFSWFADGMVQATVEGDQVLLRDVRYGLFDDRTWTPFTATALLGPDAGPLKLQQNRDPPDPGRELHAAMELLFGP